ncbi:MAG: ABC transporter ATP-binding protein [Sulfolobaceae archaeon]|jgi:ABC-2 type transport system ATP-binding protein|nr:ABC transporter ATP-binding protein [Sulfolobaceae archaeon]
MIVVQGIVKKYGEKLAVDGVSFQVNKGEFVSLLGPNGAGKTTLIRVVLALIKPNEGKVEILGKDPFKDKGVLRNVGYVQELPNLPPFLTGRQVLQLSAKIKKVGKDEVDELLALVGMSDLADRQIAKYSKGMVQRIAIAEALLGDPEILIMDEPNIGVDPVFSLHIRETFDKLKRRGASILMTSHELEDVKKLSDRVILVHKGKKVFEGGVEDLVKKYLGVIVVVEGNEAIQEIAKKLDYVKKVEKVSEGKFYVYLEEDKREELLRELIYGGASVKTFYLSQDLERAYEKAINSA